MTVDDILIKLIDINHSNYLEDGKFQIKELKDDLNKSRRHYEAKEMAILTHKSITVEDAEEILKKTEDYETPSHALDIILAHEKGCMDGYKAKEAELERIVQEHKYLTNNKHNRDLLGLNRRLVYAQVEVRELKAKEVELQKGLFIPEEASFKIYDDRKKIGYECNLHYKGSTVLGKGSTEYEALHNALEQIKDN